MRLSAEAQLLISAPAQPLRTCKRMPPAKLSQRSRRRKEAAGVSSGFAQPAAQRGPLPQSDPSETSEIMLLLWGVGSFMKLENGARIIETESWPTGCWRPWICTARGQRRPEPQWLEVT